MCHPWGGAISTKPGLILRVVYQTNGIVVEISISQLQLAKRYARFVLSSCQIACYTRDDRISNETLQFTPLPSRYGLWLRPEYVLIQQKTINTSRKAYPAQNGLREWRYEALRTPSHVSWAGLQVQSSIPIFWSIIACWVLGGRCNLFTIKNSPAASLEPRTERVQ